MLFAADRPAQYAVARLDPLDNPLRHIFVRGRCALRIRIGRTKQDAVTGRNHMPLIGRQGLEQAPGRAMKVRPICGLDHAQESMDGQDSSTAANRQIDIRLNGEAGRFKFGFGADNGAPPSELSFATDPLLAWLVQMVVELFSFE